MYLKFLSFFGPSHVLYHFGVLGMTNQFKLPLMLGKLDGTHTQFLERYKTQMQSTL